MTARLTTLLLACAIATPSWGEPLKKPLFGRKKAPVVAAPIGTVEFREIPPIEPPRVVPPTRPADVPVTTTTVPPAAASPAANAAPADVAAPDAAPPTIAELRAAYAFALPVYEMMRARYLQVSKTEALGAPGVNHLYARTTLADATSRDVTTPNNDTLYSSAWLDLAAGPVILDAPAIPNRYHSAALMDLFTNNVAIVGTRSGGKGGRYFIAGPGWRGDVPPQTTLIRSPTNDAWLLVRVLVNGPDDLTAATGLIRGFSLTDAPGERAKPVPITAVPTTNPPVAAFLAVVNEALGRNPLPPRAAAFAAAGVQPLTPANAEDAPALPPAVAAAWTKALPMLRSDIKGGLGEVGTLVDGWSYPGPNIGNYGDADDDARARVALGGLGALPRSEAIYLTATTDTAGAPLSGAKAYTVHLPAKLPVGAFWSLTMYQATPDGRLFFVDTPSKRFAVTDRTPELRAERDGSYDIFVQPLSPSGERVVNWLPSPKGPFRLIFRAYLPKPEFLDGSFKLPPVEVTEVIP